MTPKSSTTIEKLGTLVVAHALCELRCIEEQAPLRIQVEHGLNLFTSLLHSAAGEQGQAQRHPKWCIGRELLYCMTKPLQAGRCRAALGVETCQSQLYIG